MQATWEFPLPRPHTGILLGNAVMGVMAWGAEGILRLTIGRADFWDHRGGVSWDAQRSYANVRSHLEMGDQEGLERLFSRPGPAAGLPAYPSVLPLGRVDLDFGRATTLRRGVLRPGDGAVDVLLERAGQRGSARLVLSMASPVLVVRLPGSLPRPRMGTVPAWQYVGEQLRAISFEPPELFATGSLAGWVQRRPADPPLCLAYRWAAGMLAITTCIAADADAARVGAVAQLDAALEGGGREVVAAARSWWRAYWSHTPTVRLPNGRLQFLHDYGMYKLAGLTQPAGVAATLQGPWVEEYQLPPWSCDYHFNVNVQMCYWPVYQGNHLEHLGPLFTMVGDWLPTLRSNARFFLGIDDGLLLPHSVDDRCTCIGGYWAGSIDPGCTAWIAQMMFRCYRYAMDIGMLREIAYPFMLGAMRVYEALLERHRDGFALPISVSPEYVAQSGAMWGPDASFQWACIHRLCEDLLAASLALGREPRPIWREILARAPKASLVDEGGDRMIGLWRDVNLEESHRHHSHLASIVPFDTLDLDDPVWQRIVHASLNHWIRMGTGLWSGWCVPWAAMIHSRLGQGETAELLLETWQRVFTNEGHGTLHDARIPGFSLLGASFGHLPSGPTIHQTRGEIMQMDAGMAATAAIQEMLLHTRRGVNWVFPGTQPGWRDVAFDGMRTDGAFLVGALREGGRTARISVESTAGGVFSCANPWDGSVSVRRGPRSTERLDARILHVPTVPGDRLEITPIRARK